MSFLRRHVAVLVVAAAVAVLGAALLTSRGARSRALAFRFPEGAKRAYHWSLTTRVSSERSGTRRVHETSYAGTMNVHVLPGRPAPTLVVQLSPLQVRVQGEANPTMEAAFSRPFTIQIDPRGRLGEARFPPDLAATDRAVLDGAMRALQIVLPEDGDRSWTTAETDVNGEYVASYERERPDRVRKARLRYSSPRAPGAFSIRILDSSVRADVDPAGPWLARADGSERLSIEAEGGVVLALVEARFSLEPAPEPLSAEFALWNEAAAAAQVSRDAPSAAVSAWTEAERARERQRLQKDGVTLDALLAALRRRAPEDAAFAHEFAAFLRVFPGEARRIRAALRGIPDDRAPLLFNVLELAGTPEAQEVLAAIMEDRHEGKADRFRALAALAGVQNPTPEAIDRISREAFGDGASGGVASSALLALGALSPRAPGDLGPRIVGRLADELRTTDDPARQLACLRAIANARATLAPEDLSRALASNNVAVRSAAAALVAADPASADRVVQLLESERDAGTRLALVGGLSLSAAQPSVNGAIAKALGADPDAQVRARIVALLAAGIRTYPANRSILEAQLRRETDRAVIVAILNSLAR